MQLTTSQYVQLSQFNKEYQATDLCANVFFYEISLWKAILTWKKNTFKLHSVFSEIQCL